MKKIRILIVDDDPPIRTMLKNYLAQQPWQVNLAENGYEALELLNKEHFDLVILDLKLPDLFGLDVLRKMREQNVQADVIILTGYATIESAVMAIKMGARDYVQKPVHFHQFLETVQNVLSLTHLTPHILAQKLDKLLQLGVHNKETRLQDLCQAVNISKSYAGKLLKKYYKSTFRQRLAHYRIQEAKILIAAGDDPFYLIAELVGFRNARRFSEAFRRVEGMSPKEYRKICATGRKK